MAPVRLAPREQCTKTGPPVMFSKTGRTLRSSASEGGGQPFHR